MPQGFMRVTGWLLLIAVLLIPSAASAEEGARPEGIGQTVADTYDFAHWDQIEEIHFTFNVLRGDKHTKRSWRWRPKEDFVSYSEYPGAPIAYNRGDLDQKSHEDVIKTDHRFINDSYWLLFPYQLVWSDPTITDEGESGLPIGEGTGRKLIVQYPDDGGYTPGDAYDIYLNNAGTIVQWDFRKGGGDTGRAMTWEADVQLGPIKVCTDHYNADKSFRLWFDGLSVTTVDGEKFKIE